MTSDEYFRGPSGTRYTYAEIADRIRKEVAAHARQAHLRATGSASACPTR